MVNEFWVGDCNPQAAGYVSNKKNPFLVLLFSLISGPKLFYFITYYIKYIIVTRRIRKSYKTNDLICQSKLLDLGI